MTEQAARLPGPCRECGGVGTEWLVQSTNNGCLSWEVEWDCDTCGISHDSGEGWAPSRVRNAILEQHGPHCLKLVDVTAHGGTLLKSFRVAFGTSIQEAKRLSDELKRSGFEGTLVETTLLSELLEKNGISSVTQPGRCS